MTMKKNEYRHVVHTFGPLYNENSKVVVLGSIPSPASREVGFYYGHPRNRFWMVLAQVLEAEVPGSIEEKKRLVLDNGLALWDVIEECDIIGASDSSVRNVVPTEMRTCTAPYEIGAKTIVSATYIAAMIAPSAMIFALKVVCFMSPPIFRVSQHLNSTAGR